MLGAGAWIVSQLIDAGLNEHWGWTVIPEELFEMAGSALFGLALLVALRQLRRDADGSRAQSPHAARRPASEPLVATHWSLREVAPPRARHGRARRRTVLPGLRCATDGSDSSDRSPEAAKNSALPVAPRRSGRSAMEPTGATRPAAWPT